MKKHILITLLFLTVIITCQAQEKSSIAIIKIDSKNFEYDQEVIGNMVRIEVEKLDIYEVMDNYDMKDIILQKKIEICYGKTCLVRVGKELGVDYILTGSVEKLGNKIILSLRLINIEKDIVAKTNIMEYLDLPEHINKMIEISVKNIAGISNDANLVDRLVNFEDPMIIPQTSLKLDGPRMGIAYMSGEFGNRIMEEESVGGWGVAFPMMTQFGYQFETQYLSAGNFQGLFEYLFMISGLEKSIFSPSFIFMNGFRSNKTGWEIGFGPSFGFKRIADGYYDIDGLQGKAGEWHLNDDWTKFTDTSNIMYVRASQKYSIESRLDKRGQIKISTGFVYSVGKTFQSGYLNIPVNVFIAPRKTGTSIGISIGFNVNKNSKDWK